MGGRGGTGHRNKLSLSRELADDPILPPDATVTPEQSPEPASTPPTEQLGPAPAPDAPIEDWDRHIQQAHELLAKEINSEYVPLLKLRALLSDVPREVQDMVFKAVRQANPNVHFAPDSNRKALGPEDHNAAHLVGGEPKHLIAFEKFDDHGNKISWWWRPGAAT